MLVRTAALVAAVAVLLVVILPPARLIPATTFDDGSVPGVVHVHTNRSDGRSSPETIAAIAARAGLAFVVFADHGNGTRQLDPPTYRHGVLCLDGVEISTTRGHLLALAMNTAPYPLGGEPRTVLEDVARLGGFGIAAHPDSPKPELTWRDWDVPVDGLELINLDSVWRAQFAVPGWRSKLGLLGALVAYPFRPSEAMAGLVMDRPALLERWAELTRARPVALVGGADVHARLALGDAEPQGPGWALALPSYEAVFRTLTLRLRPERALTGDAAQDAGVIYEAIRRGRAYLALDGVMAPPSFTVVASNDMGTASMGETLAPGGRVTVTVRTNAPPSFTTTIWRDRDQVFSGPSQPEVRHVDDASTGTYRAEVRATERDGRPVWLSSNPIYVRTAVTPPPRQGRPSGRVGTVLFDGRQAATWQTEAGAASVVAFDIVRALVGEREIRVRWGLPGGDAAGQYVALTVETPHGIEGHDRLVFTGRAERPMRVSVQLRLATAADPQERWHHSVHLDTTRTTHSVFFEELRPLDAPSGTALDLSRVRNLLFVVDTTNTVPGASGMFWVSQVALHR